MPVTPLFEWEQTNEDVLLHVSIKGCKKEAVDVVIADVFVKVNAPPQYLLTLDLLYEIVPSTSAHHFTEEEAGITLHLRLRKVETGLLWDALRLLATSLGKTALQERRQASLKRAEEHYQSQLDARASQRAAEQRRLQEAQWAVEQAQRTQIEHKVLAERTAAEEELYAWEDDQRAAGEAKAALADVSSSPSSSPAETPKTTPQSPADLYAVAAVAAKNKLSVAAASSPAVPGVREVDTAHVMIDFTPKTLSMPTRSRGDEDYYRQSRYKPVSIEDTPMFWKARADAAYKAHSWKAASDAYTESIKRDGAFLTCVMNRAACHLHLADYRRAIEDCSLALTMLANTPASEVTQDRYRGLMTKLYARRGAAYCWAEELQSGAADLRMAAAYRDPATDADVAADLALVEAQLQARGIVEEAGSSADPFAVRLQTAATHYYQGAYAEAETGYRAVLEEDPYQAKAQANLVAVLLRQGKFRAALDVCERIIVFCAEVASALEQPGGFTSDQLDSDDEEELEEAAQKDSSTANSAGQPSGASTQAGASSDNGDALVRQRRAATRKVGEQSGHVYMLLKAYVRSAAALCGLKEYHKAHAYLERALRITPYDNDLRDDCNRLAEKIRMETLVAASAGVTSGSASAAAQPKAVAA